MGSFDLLIIVHLPLISGIYLQVKGAHVQMPGAQIDGDRGSGLKFPCRGLFKKNRPEQSNAIANTDIYVCNFILHLSPGDSRLQAREEVRT